MVLELNEILTKIKLLKSDKNTIEQCVAASPNHNNGPLRRLQQTVREMLETIRKCSV